MKKINLHTLYPEAVQHPYPSKQKEFLSVPDGKGYLWVPVEKLSTKEAALLLLLSEEIQPSIENSDHLWYQILFQQKKIEVSDFFRVIQIQLQTPKDFDYTIWKTHIRGIFPQVEDFFFLSPQQALLIERQSKQALAKEELDGIFLTLDDDFETVSRVFIGGFHESTAEFPLLFEEEGDIFKEESTRVKRQVFSIADVALHYFTKEALAKSNLTQSMKKEWRIDDEMKEIIQALWGNQGNLSSTAKELFMHRNTLQYRLEKFQENTGMQLKNTDDLILCYLLLND